MVMLMSKCEPALRRHFWKVYSLFNFLAFFIVVIDDPGTPTEEEPGTPNTLQPVELIRTRSRKGGRLWYTITISS